MDPCVSYTPLDVIRISLTYLGTGLDNAIVGPGIRCGGKRYASSHDERSSPSQNDKSARRGVWGKKTKRHDAGPTKLILARYRGIYRLAEDGPGHEQEVDTRSVAMEPIGEEQPARGYYCRNEE